MLLIHRRGRLAAVALLALAAGAAGMACDPTPSFPPPAQPLVGRVLFERELTMGTEPIDVTTYAATLHVAPGTVPVGTKLVVRIVDGVVKDLTDGGDIWSHDGLPAAVQLLSDAPTFARPIQLEVPNDRGPSWNLQPAFCNGSCAVGPITVDVLHADEGATAWTRLGVAVPDNLSSRPGAFTAEVTEPHLWTMAMPPGPKLQAPSGLYRLDRLYCETYDVVTTPPETLEIDGDRYVWTRGPSTDPCAPVERGTLGLDLPGAKAVFTPDVGDAYDFNIYPQSSFSFVLKGIRQTAAECAANTTTSLSFVRTKSPGASDGGCATDAGATDAGGSGDAQGG
jgi:hypothetical protein